VGDVSEAYAQGPLSRDPPVGLTSLGLRVAVLGRCVGTGGVSVCGQGLQAGVSQVSWWPVVQASPRRGGVSIHTPAHRLTLCCPGLVPQLEPFRLNGLQG
jgi:hypothetical protein